MHILHKILVYIPDVVSEECDRHTLIEAIRSYAEENTSDFYTLVYDWRETDSAGRWSRKYPVNVLLGKDDIRRFLQELEETQKYYMEKIQFTLKQLEETVGTDLREIVKKAVEMPEYDVISSIYYFYLKELSSFLYGSYQSYSGFYNLHKNNARIYLKDLEDIKNSPEQWALVLFDYHF